MSDDIIRRLRADDARLRQTETKESPLDSSGAAFPASPASGRLFFRTDLGFLCYYDGTRWLTVHEYSTMLGWGDSAAVSFAAAANVVRFASMRSDYTPWWTRAHFSYATGAVNDGANKLGYTFLDSNATTLWTFDTGGDAINSTINKAATPPTQSGAAISFLYLNIAIAGAPSAQFPRTPVFYYRLIIP